MSTQKSKWALRTESSNASGERPALSYRDDRGIQASELEEGGFSGTCENTSLADWIQFVQMGRRDAVVSLRTHDGKMGRLWCRDGDIVDASCDGLVGTDAVYRALSWEGGKVSVDFRKFERTRRIPMATPALLLEAAYRRDSGVRELAGAASRASSAPSSTGGLAASTPPPEPAQKKGRRALRVGLALAALLAAVGLWIAVSSWVSPARRESAAPVGAVEFLVRIDVEPADAQISLDGKPAGVGQLNRSMTRDGRTHEILCSADGYLSERLFFRDTPLQQRLILTRDNSSQSGDRTTSSGPARTPSTPRAHSAPARPRPALPQVKPPSGTPRSDVPSEKPREPPAAKVNVQIIEERSPHIQIIDERKPRIEVIE